LYGVRLDLSEAWATPRVRAAVYDGYYEVEEATVLLGTISADDRILEIGCGAGFITTLASRAAAAVQSYDANPAMAAAAKRTLDINGAEAAIVNGVLQVGPGATDIDFFVREDFPRSSLTNSPGATRVRVPALDFAAEVTAHRASYLMIDIEGGETDLLQAPVPACVKKLTVECHPTVTGHAAVSAMLASLLAQGFVADLETSRLPVLFLER
jgi:FkbM family methyltransferase